MPEAIADTTLSTQIAHEEACRGRSLSRAERETFPQFLAIVAASVRATAANDRAQSAARRASAASVANDRPACDAAYQDAHRAAVDALEAWSAENTTRLDMQFAASRIRLDETLAGRALGPMDRELGEGRSVSEFAALSAKTAADRAFRSLEGLSRSAPRLAA